MGYPKAPLGHLGVTLPGTRTHFFSSGCALLGEAVLCRNQRLFSFLSKKKILLLALSGLKRRFKAYK